MALLRRFSLGGQPDPVVIEPLTPEEAGRLRLSLFSRFSPTDILDKVEEHPDLAWRVRGQDAYALGSLWRHRDEIGEVVEVTRGSHRAELLRSLLRSFEEKGIELVVLDYQEASNDTAFYTENGFWPIERIIEYERTPGSSQLPEPGAPIRRAHTHDLETILEIERDSFPWLWWNSPVELAIYQRQPGVELYLSFDGDRAIGYAGVTVRGTNGHLDRLAVRQACQGKGHGSALTSSVLRRLEDIGVRRVALSTQQNNHRSQALYERHGFRRTRWTYDIRGFWLREPREYQ